MAMATLRREGRRLLLSPIAPNPSSAMRSAMLISPEQSAPIGLRSISTQVVRNRMKSVKNIQKITKAMKMVAASKLRAVQVRTENSRGLWQPFTALLGDTPSVDVKKNVIVTITSDKVFVVASIQHRLKSASLFSRSPLVQKRRPSMSYWEKRARFN
uniref:ATP synthase subunit gamma, mitochondrial n=1 Tax=Ananas comosus var. bracteatus TaxID=296719 RepID=A0A6V7NX69_ANACO|nr:unnamed protein product [Ananas comosus var. bracteatus]